MRAIPEEVSAARAEGIFFRFHAVPVLVEEGQVRRLSLRLREANPREPEAFAVRPPAGEASSEFWTEVDTVVVAVGADPDLAFLDGSGLCEAGRVSVDAWGRTRLGRLFAGGDASSLAAGTVAGAINAGKRAALAIHSSFGHESLDERALRLVRGPGVAADVTHRDGHSARSGRVQAVPPLRTINLRHFPETARAVAKQRAPDEAIWGFEEADLGLPTAKASAEARQRCFHCGVCTHCDTCLKACPVGAISKSDGFYRVDPRKCTGCRLCQVECPRSAITMPAVGSCVGCGYCTTWLECPSLVRGPDGLVEIDRRTCVDCGLCAQVCCQGAIQPRETLR
jgi:ferredoxin